MRLEHYPVDQLKSQIISIVGRYLSLSDYKVFFFGSRVTGKSTDHSDIDVGIEGPGSISWEIIAKIREDVENLPTLYKIEIVDFREVSSDFYRVAIAHREYL